MSAERLREAADRLDALADEAEQAGYGSDRVGEPWCPDWTYTVVRHVQRNLDADCPKHGDDPDGECNTWGRYAGPYIAVMHPGVGKALAEWLRAAADDRVAQPYLKQSWDDASIALADAILGGAA